MALFTGDKVEIAPALQPASDLLQETLKAVEDELRLRGYSPRTRKAYRLHIERFLRYVGKNPREAAHDDILAYLLLLVEEERHSRSYHNQAVSARKFLYARVFKIPLAVAELPRPRKEQKLPAALSQEAVLRLLNAVNNIKHRALLILVYSAGLGVSEVVRLRLEDLDKERRLIRVRYSEGRKVCYTLLSAVALQAMQAYREVDRPEGWLFPGPMPGKHLNARTVQKVLGAQEQSGIPQQVTVHTLRHSFATHLLEAGEDLRYIQEPLGHISPKTTEIGSHVSQKDLRQTRSLLDTLELETKECEIGRKKRRVRFIWSWG